MNVYKSERAIKRIVTYGIRLFLPRKKCGKQIFLLNDFLHSSFFSVRLSRRKLNG